MIVAVGSNNLSLWGEAAEDPHLVLEQVKDLLSSIASLEHRPNVVICTVLKRLHAKHSNISDFNALVVNSNRRYLKLHREVQSSTFF